MRNTRRYPICFLVTLVLAAQIVGCATTTQVREIVAKTNAAIIAGPQFHLAGEKVNNTKWQEAIGEMDQVISANPDQAILINHLRVRQAMLLTIYEKDNLARQRWEMVKGEELTTERDKMLYAVRDALVWWYKRAPNSEPLSKAEIEKIINYCDQLSTQIDDLETHELKVYLATIRAQMRYKIDSESDPRNPEQMTKLQASMVMHLKEFVDVFTSEQHKWVKKNAGTVIPKDDLEINEIRNRVWLKSLIKKYIDEAEGFGFPQKTEWEPDWIRELKFTP